MWTHPDSTVGQHQSPVVSAFASAVDETLYDPRCEYIGEISWGAIKCAHCHGALTRLDERGSRDFSVDDGEQTSIAELVVCQRCGWWAAVAAELEIELEHETWYGTHRSTRWPRAYDRPVRGVARGRRISITGCLARFHEASGELDLPVNELERYLLARPDARFLINPYNFEALVASVFRNHGHTVVETARSRDGGVDLFLIGGPAAGLCAVQVKRYRAKVGVATVREFRGALLETPSVAKGILVTSSSFTRGARLAASLPKPVPIELMDANRLLDALGCQLRPAYDHDDLASAAFAEPWATIASRLSGEHWTEADLADNLIRELVQMADAEAVGEHPRGHEPDHTG